MNGKCFRETNDGGCVNDKQIRDFTDKHTTVPVTKASSQCDAEGGACTASEGGALKYTSQSEESFTYTVVNPAFGDTMRGMKILQQIVSFRTSTIKVGLKLHY